MGMQVLVGEILHLLSVGGKAGSYDVKSIILQLYHVVMCFWNCPPCLERERDHHHYFTKVQTPQSWRATNGCWP